jgi:hypothetical protein
MLIFIVKASITRQDYMEDARKPVDDIRPVYAKDAEEAEAKYLAYWEAQESSYSISYRVSIREVVEPIL